jgi:hypothetical protein
VTAPEGTLEAVLAEMENGIEYGTMPGVRRQVRRHWAARIRAALARGDREALRKAITPVVNQGLDDYKMGRASNDELTHRLVDAVAGLLEPEEGR